MQVLDLDSVTPSGGQQVTVHQADIFINVSDVRLSHGVHVYSMLRKGFWNVFLRDIIRFKLLNNNVHVDELSELSDDVKGPVLDSIVTQGNMLDFQV